MKEPQERFHPLWAHQEKLALQGALSKELSLKMSSLESELMNEALEISRQRKEGGGNEEMGRFLFHLASEQEMAL